MLTISDIKNKKFEKAAFGYKPEDVENFLNEILDFISSLENEKAESNQKLVVLANKIEEYRNEEDSLRQALLGAQKLGDSILKEAKNRAEIMMRDATIKSENILKNVQDDVKREEVILNKMKREVDAFRSKILTLYSSQTDLIKSLPEIERKKAAEEQAAEPAPVEEQAAEPAAPAAETAAPAEPVEPAAQNVSEPQPSTRSASHDAEKKEENSSSFQIGTGFQFSHFDEEPKRESKFGPLKFGEGYDLDDDKKR